MPSTVPLVTTNLGRLLSRVSSIAIVAGTALSSAFAATDSEVTFHRDVAPVLQKNCQTCHRPGDIGPMPLLTYEQARPWAKAIRAAVSSKTMPPWHADRRYGTFSNDRSLSRVRDRDLGAVGRDRRQRGFARRRAADADLRRGMADRHSRRRLRDAQGVRRSRDGDGDVPVDPGPDRLHRGQVGAGGRGAPRQSRRRPPRRGLCPRRRRRLGQRSAGRRVLQPVLAGAAEARRGQHDVLAEARAGAPRGVRAGRRPHRAATRPGPLDQGRLLHRVRDALHADRRAGERSQQRRAGLRRDAAHAAGADGPRPERQQIFRSLQAKRTTGSSPGCARCAISRSSRSCRTCTCAASRWSSAPCIPTASRKCSCRCPATISTGR